MRRRPTRLPEAPLLLQRWSPSSRAAHAAPRLFSYGGSSSRSGRQCDRGGFRDEGHEVRSKSLGDALVDEASLCVECVRGSCDWQLAVDDPRAGDAEHAPQVLLRPDRSVPTRRRTSDGRCLAPDRAPPRGGREAQSIAFFSTPGIEPLYSGVTKATRRRPRAGWRSPPPPGSSPSTSSSYGGSSASAS